MQEFKIESIFYPLIKLLENMHFVNCEDFLDIDSNFHAIYLYVFIFFFS